MKASSDKMYNKYKDLDFADAKLIAETPHLARLQAEGIPVASTQRGLRGTSYGTTSPPDKPKK